MVQICHAVIIGNTQLTMIMAVITYSVQEQFKCVGIMRGIQVNFSDGCRMQNGNSG